MTKIKIIPLSDRQPEAIIFDLGGVLLNLDLQKTIDAFRLLGFDNVEEKMARIFKHSTEAGAAGLFQRYETGRITSAQFRDTIREHAGRYISDEEIDRAWAAMLRDLPPVNIRILEKLSASYKLYLLSNTNAIHIETLTQNPGKENGFPGLVKLFDKVYYSHILKMRKPDVEIFTYVIEDAGLNAETTLFIDDSAPNIEGAKEAGLMTVHHKRNAGLDQIFKTD